MMWIKSNGYFNPEHICYPVLPTIAKYGNILWVILAGINLFYNIQVTYQYQFKLWITYTIILFSNLWNDHNVVKRLIYSTDIKVNQSWFRVCILCSSGFIHEL